MNVTETIAGLASEEVNSNAQTITAFIVCDLHTQMIAAEISIAFDRIYATLLFVFSTEKLTAMFSIKGHIVR